MPDIIRTNPLFGPGLSDQTVRNLQTKEPTLGAPKSPVTGKLMERVTCSGIPAWWCPTSRIVLPVAAKAV